MNENHQPQSATVVARPKKSMGIALALTILFGPLGLLYASVSIGLIMLPGISITAATLGDLEIVGIFGSLISIGLCVLAIKNHNSILE
ncbi:hypothetical protein [Candidatus Spongiihabitans sp.]|uniref:hypothetical protein n=1 Tax=Candidatus Spongiihabitans sp. TaxID=3101308 RepID=UPI003C6ED7D6